MDNEQRTALVILDFDGTLVDTRDDIVDGINQALDDLGLPRRPGPEIAGFIGRGVETLVARSLPPGHEDLRLPMLERFRARYSNCFDHTARLYPGVPEVLETLRQRDVQLAVASNKPSLFLVKLLEKFDLRTRFMAVLGGDTMDHKKPDPWSVRHICTLSRVPPEQTLMVGDMRYDVETGVNAGTRTCGVLYGYGSAEELREAGADHLVPTFPDVLPLVH